VDGIASLNGPSDLINDVLSPPLIASSFKIELPAFFGKDSNNASASKDTRVLPAFQSAEEWDPNDEYTRANHLFNRRVEEAKESMMASSTRHLKQEWR
jgi:hypothetical protein